MTNPTPVAGPAAELVWVRAGPPVPILLVNEDGSRVWSGIGPPPLVVGSRTNDLYLATDTGDLYRLLA